jgi:hypothetical protein
MNTYYFKVEGPNDEEFEKLLEEYRCAAVNLRRFLNGYCFDVPVSLVVNNNIEKPPAATDGFSQD